MIYKLHESNKATQEVQMSCSVTTFYLRPCLEEIYFCLFVCRFVCTLGVGHEAVERRDVACVARGDSEGVELKEAESRGST